MKGRLGRSIKCKSIHLTKTNAAVALLQPNKCWSFFHASFLLGVDLMSGYPNVNSMRKGTVYISFVIVPITSHIYSSSSTRLMFSNKYWNTLPDTSSLKCREGQIKFACTGAFTVHCEMSLKCQYPELFVSVSSSSGYAIQFIQQDFVQETVAVHLLRVKCPCTSWVMREIKLPLDKEKKKKILISYFR